MRNFLAFLTLLTICHAVVAAELFGTVDAVSGSAFVADQSGKSVTVSAGQKIYEGQTINSGPDGEVHLVTEDGGIIAVRPYTTFRVDEYKAEGNSTDKIFMSLLKGTVRSITGWIGKSNNSAYRITTPTATIGIRGTDHETTVIDKGDGDEPGTYDNVNEGSTVLKTQHGTAEVTPGKFAFAPKGRAAAPFFLPRQPHFLAVRKLRIEGRILQRKEFLHGRLDHMREERIQRVRSIQGKRPEHTGEHRGNIQKPDRMQNSERRKEIREHRGEQFRQHQQERRLTNERSRAKKPGEIKERTEQRKEVISKDKGTEKEKRRKPERRHRE
jgi:hypothetical protein